MPCLTRPCLALLVPALSCHGLSVPKLAFPYPVWLCIVQHCSSRRPCPVLLTMLDPVRSCPALLNTDRPFVALPGPSRPRLVLTGAALFHSAWRCPARHCSAMVGLARTCPVPPYAANYSTIVHPFWFYLILPGPGLPYIAIPAPVRCCCPCQVLSSPTGHVRNVAIGPSLDVRPACQG